MMYEKQVNDYREEYPQLKCAGLVYKIMLDELNIVYSKQELDLIDGLSGGLGILSICGVYLSGIATMKRILIYYEKEYKFYYYRIKFIYMLREKLTDINCGTLQDRYANVENTCNYIICSAITVLKELILDDIIRKE